LGGWARSGAWNGVARAESSEAEEMSAEHTRRIIAEGKAEAARLKELRMEQEREAREESVADRVRRKAKAKKPAWMERKMSFPERVQHHIAIVSNLEIDRK